ncbi:MAG: hypothetical protein QG597_101 [Actinomycetota bacterium]|nr:hypothetical protein [Actinomycetota bacterium]
MRAAVIGTGWGRVHIAALQRLGVEVAAVCGTELARTEQVARDCGIALALTDIDRLRHLGLDLITIAAPTSAHAHLVAHLGPTPLLCEKPAVGVESPVANLPSPSGPVWVNYAFPFLEVVAQAESVLASMAWQPGDGTASADHAAVDVVSHYDLGGLVTANRSDWQWLTDVASHPWSWVVSRFGRPVAEVDGWQVDGGGAGLAYRSTSGVAVSVTALPIPGLAGLRHDLTVRLAGHSVSFGGAFHLGRDWSFGPVLLDGTAVARGEEEPVAFDADPWFLANVTAIESVVRAVGGDASRPPPFTWDQALILDACVQQAAGTR